MGKTPLPKAGNKSAEMVLLAPQEAGVRWDLVSLMKWLSLENNGLHLGLSTPP